MKKVLSVLMSIIMLIIAAVPACFAKNDTAAVIEKDSVAEAVRAAGDEYPIVFVTGIGQTFSYYLDDASEKTMYLHGEPHHFSTMANLFLLDTELITIIEDAFSALADENAGKDDVVRALTQIKNNKILMDCFGTQQARQDFLAFIGQLLRTYITGEYSVDYETLCSVAANVLKDNVIDENGKLPDYILTSTYQCPVSEFDVNPDGTENSAFGKGRFYRDIPCREILSEIGEENVFCYSYAAFGSLTNISQGLDHLINDVILGKDGYFPDAEKVVLIPMSMGAAVVSQYLYNCEKAEKDPHVARVVSIVGCWDGSDIMADLIERKYVENSAELFYSKWDVICGNNTTTGVILDNVMRLFHHDNLSQLITDLLGAICDELVLKSPSMLALIPSGRYDAIREEYLTKPGRENILEQLDKYHEAQTGLKDRMQMLNEKYGTEFFFISGYALNLGAGYETYDSTKDNYTFFCFLNAADKVNSDEIIPIQSTMPGTTWVKVGEKFSDEYMSAAKANGTDKFIDPYSQSIDVSTSFYPEHSWAFYQQIHQLDNNNTALRLAFKIASGEISSIYDCEDTYPQFNDSRDLRKIKDGINNLVRIIEACGEKDEFSALKAEAEEYLEKAQGIVESTINHRDEEEAFGKEISTFCAKATRTLQGLPEEEPAEKSFWDENGDGILKAIDGVISKALGVKGFPDVSITMRIYNALMRIVFSFIPVIK